MPIDVLNIDTIEASNLADQLDEEVLKRIGMDAREGYISDLNSMQGVRDRNDSILKLAMQVMEVKNDPWANSSNVKHPLLTIAATNFQARAYPALVPATNVAKARFVGRDPTGEKVQRSIRIGAHMSYQLLSEMEEWEEDMDKLLLIAPLFGHGFKKTYYCPVRERNVSELVLPNDLVVSYYAKSLEDASRKSHILYYYPNELEEMYRDDLFLRCDFGESSISTKDNVVVEVQDIDAPAVDDERPLQFIEQETWLDLDEDGYKEPYIVTFEEESGKVVRIVPRFYRKNIETNRDGEIIRIQPIEFYTNYIFIPDPQSGICGIGFGHLLGPIGHSVNTLINMLIDSGAMHTLQAGFISKGTRILAGDTKFKLGEWKLAQHSGDDLRKSIVPLPTREPSAVLQSLLLMLIGSAEKLSSTTEVMTGGLPGQNTKATVALQAVKEGSRVLTSIYKRFFRSFTKELKKLFILNSIYLKEEDYFKILDSDMGSQMPIAREDYNLDDFDVIPTADPNAASDEQRMAKIQAVMEVIPLGQINPQEFTRRYLEATEQSNIKALMTLPPKGPSPEELEHQREMAKLQLEQQKLEIEAQKVKAQIERDIANAILTLKKADAEDGKADTERARLAIESMKSTNAVIDSRIKTLSDAKKASKEENSKDGGDSNTD